VTFRTAFIVGFPGETDDTFQELTRYVEQAEFDRVAVFLYSDEEGTPAVQLGGKVERALMEERRNELLSVQETIAAAKGGERVGSTLEVMVDGFSEEDGRWLEGRHEGLAPDIDGVVYIEAGEGKPGQVVEVKITDATTYDLIGSIVGASGTGPSHPPIRDKADGYYR
jgi:ribosomal protein S12 methylthiotransferase